MIRRVGVFVVLLGVCAAHDTSPNGGCEGEWRWSPFGKCHLFVTSTKLSWNGAQTACLKLGGNLATIRNHNEGIWIKGTRLYYGLGLASGFWIGGYKRDNKWYWMGKTGDQQVYDTDWTKGQPDNETGVQNCLALFYQDISPQLQWGDGNCEREVNYICEKPQNANPFG